VEEDFFFPCVQREMEGGEREAELGTAGRHARVTRQLARLALPFFFFTKTGKQRTQAHTLFSIVQFQ
jgi:hypothetical protein